MAIDVRVQSTPLRPCRWCWRMEGESTRWTEGWFHMFFERSDSSPGVVLETSTGEITVISPITSLMLQFTDREENGPPPCCDQCQIPA